MNAIKPMGDQPCNKSHEDRVNDGCPARYGHAVARMAALLTSIVLALTGARWAMAGNGWLDGGPGARPLAALDGATAWINSPPLDAKSLQGKVVLVDFWTYSCINCLRTLPYLRAWSQKYAPQGLVVLGAHAPEFNFERSTRNVQRAVKDLGIDYPVAIDGRQALWEAFGTHAWPTLVFVDSQGRVRDRLIGEGRYEQAERLIQQMLREAGREKVPADLVTPQGQGTQAAAGRQIPASDETYLGTARASGFVAAAGRLSEGSVSGFTPSTRLDLNQWTLAGAWKADPEYLELAQPSGRIAYRFKARDLHLVLGPSSDGQAPRFRVRIDGRAPGTDHGADTDADGAGRVDAHRLYQLVRQASGNTEHVFEIEFLDKGVRAYAFTFG